MIASGVVLPAMYVLGVIFAALWFTGIWLGRKWERASGHAAGASAPSPVGSVRVIQSISNA